MTFCYGKCTNNVFCLKLNLIILLIFMRITLFKPRTLSLVFFLSVVWLLLSGHYNPLMLFFGVISVIFTVIIAHRMDLVDHEGHPVHLTWRVPFYWFWLFGQIIISNIQVAIHILSPKLRIDPKIISIKMNQKNDLDKANFGNSITLTPGTVSLKLDDDGNILVHALDNNFGKELESGKMEKKIRELS